MGHRCQGGALWERWSLGKQVGQAREQGQEAFRLYRKKGPTGVASQNPRKISVSPGQGFCFLFVFFLPLKTDGSPSCLASLVLQFVFLC